MLLSGEAGIGKSRLTSALMDRVATEPQTRLRYFCSPQHTDSALYPIIGQMERAVRFAHGDTAQAKLDKLDGVLAQSSTPPHEASLIAEMLSLQSEGRYPKLDLSSQQRRQKTLEALNAQVEASSRMKPILMIFEDAHWIDPTSLEVLGRTVDRIKTLPVLLVVTYRPEFELPWVGQPHVTAITVNRLGQREIAAMIDRVIGNKALAASVRESILERTDGIPLFVEEITKAVLEAGDQHVEQAITAIPTPSIAVPVTLHASLMARLDRLGSAKTIAQVGAVVGREFSYALLRAVTGKPEVELQSALDRLTDAGLLLRQGALPHATYLFKHALVQDAAYGTLLRDGRRALHRRTAETLENDFSEIADTQPELLARHFSEAGLTEKAASYWSKAGQRSLGRSALVEAVEQVTRALGHLSMLPAGPAQRRDHIKLQVTLINPLMQVKGYAALETKAAIERARLLIAQAEACGETPEDPLLLFSVLYSSWAANYVGFNGDALRGLASEFLALAEKQNATGPLVVGHRLVGTSFACTGDIRQGRAHLDRAAALYAPAEHRSLALRFGQDVRVSILSYRGMALWMLGFPAAALADADQLLTDAREIGRATTLMYGLTHSALIQLLLRDSKKLVGLAVEVVPIAEEKRALLWKGVGMALQGYVLSLNGQASEAVQTITEGLDLWQLTGSTVWAPYLRMALATAHSELGRFDEAWREVSESLAEIENTGPWTAQEDRRMCFPRLP